MKHQMIYCNGRLGDYICRCQCGEMFQSQWLSDLIHKFNSHSKQANSIETENVISIFTKRPLLV